MPELTEESLIKTIKASCGYPKISFELPDDTLKIYIQQAVDWASQYVNNYHYVEVNTPVYDMTPLKANAVTRVYRAPYAETDNEFDIFRAYTVSNMGLIDTSMVIQAQSILSQWEQIRSDGYRLINGKLYLYNYSGTVVVEYTKDCVLQEIVDPKWKNYVKQYALALAKIGIGRIRSKFSLSNIPVTFDGETLLTEGKEEKERLENLAIEQGEGIFYVEST